MRVATSVLMPGREAGRAGRGAAGERGVRAREAGPEVGATDAGWREAGSRGGAKSRCRCSGHG
jgi:hypothetical protein